MNERNISLRVDDLDKRNAIIESMVKPWGKAEDKDDPARQATRGMEGGHRLQRRGLKGNTKGSEMGQVAQPKTNKKKAGWAKEPQLVQSITRIIAFKTKPLTIFKFWQHNNSRYSNSSLNRQTLGR
jgi:hypothetical protein